MFVPHTHDLLEQADWSDLTAYKISFARLCTEQTCNEMAVMKTVLETLVLAAGGCGTTSFGGGGLLANSLIGMVRRRKLAGEGSYFINRQKEV